MDFKDKLKHAFIPNEDKKEDIDSTEDDSMEYEQRPISDEVEQLDGEPIKIKTMLVKSQEEDVKESETSRNMKTIVKVAAGVGLAAAAGIATLLLLSRKKK